MMLLLSVAGCACGPSRGAGDSGSGGAARAPGAQAALARGQVRIPSGKSFDVEVVQDPRARQRGLQHRARLDPGEGMLFVFPRPAKERFWMYECLIPLDILWLDAAGRVIHIENALPICSALPCPDYGPDQDALYVLELGAGVAARSGLAVGQRLEILFADPPHPT